MLKRLLSFSLLVLLIASCKNETPKTELDLLSHGLPISIQAPDNPEITVDDLGFWKDVSVKAGEDYHIQIISSDASTIDIAKIKAEQLELVKEAPFFSKIIKEEDNGFTFEKKIDDRINHDFRYVKIQGDKEYIFRGAMMGTFTEGQVASMYESVK